MIQITYQKRDGSIMQRLRNTMLPYKIGDNTSMGWKVLNIEYEYKNKFYSECEYNRLMRKKKQLWIKKRQTKEICLREFKAFIYSFFTIIIINFLRILLGF